ncbi:hypothetical protein [Algoriphagus aquimarinus]|uniref:hypothetical protein n=1 Tax=Algoriphagus aquimarinus TaxID=237018 RepID=UPI0030DCF15B
MIKKLLFVFSLFLISNISSSQDLAVLTQREQAEVIDSWLEYRIQNLLPVKCWMRKKSVGVSIHIL